MSSSTVTGGDRRSETRFDADLLRDSVTGDQAAFAILFRRHARVTYAAAFGIVQRREDAEEAVQDAFLTLWRKRATINLATESLIPWLVVTARNHARNRVRSAIRARTDALDEHAAALVAEDPAVVATLSLKLQSALDTLPPLDREIVQLCLVDDIAYEDAAKQLGLSHGSVRNRLSRARSIMRGSLHDLDKGTNS